MKELSIIFGVFALLAGIGNAITTAHGESFIGIILMLALFGGFYYGLLLYIDKERHSEEK